MAFRGKRIDGKGGWIFASLLEIKCNIENREPIFKTTFGNRMSLAPSLHCLNPSAASVIMPNPVRSFKYPRLAHPHSHLLCGSCQSAYPKAAPQASQFGPSSMWYSFRFWIAPWTLVVVRLSRIDWYSSRISGIQDALSAIGRIRESSLNIIPEAAPSSTAISAP